MRWHTELTGREFTAIDRADTVIDVFFGDRSPEDLCRIGGFQIKGLREQFWESIAEVARAFDLKA